MSKSDRSPKSPETPKAPHAQQIPEETKTTAVQEGSDGSDEEKKDTNKSPIQSNSSMMGRLMSGASVVVKSAAGVVRPAAELFERSAVSATQVTKKVFNAATGRSPKAFDAADVTTETTKTPSKPGSKGTEEKTPARKQSVAASDTARTSQIEAKEIDIDALMKNIGVKLAEDVSLELKKQQQNLKTAHNAFKEALTPLQASRKLLANFSKETIAIDQEHKVSGNELTEELQNEFLDANTKLKAIKKATSNPLSLDDVKQASVAYEKLFILKSTLIDRLKKLAEYNFLDIKGDKKREDDFNKQFDDIWDTKSGGSKHLHPDHLTVQQIKGFFLKLSDQNKREIEKKERLNLPPGIIDKPEFLSLSFELEKTINNLKEKFTAYYNPLRGDLGVAAEQINNASFLIPKISELIKIAKDKFNEEKQAKLAAIKHAEQKETEAIVRGLVRGAVDKAIAAEEKEFEAKEKIQRQLKATLVGIVGMIQQAEPITKLPSFQGDKSSVAAHLEYLSELKSEVDNYFRNKDKLFSDRHEKYASSLKKSGFDQDEISFKPKMMEHKEMKLSSEGLMYYNDSDKWMILLSEALNNVVKPASLNTEAQVALIKQIYTQLSDASQKFKDASVPKDKREILQELNELINSFLAGNKVDRLEPQALDPTISTTETILVRYLIHIRNYLSDKKSQTSEMPINHFFIDLFSKLEREGISLDDSFNFEKFKEVFKKQRDSTFTLISSLNELNIMLEKTNIPQSQYKPKIVASDINLTKKLFVNYLKGLESYLHSKKITEQDKEITEQDLKSQNEETKINAVFYFAFCKLSEDKSKNIEKDFNEFTALVKANYNTAFPPLKVEKKQDQQAEIKLDRRALDLEKNKAIYKFTIDSIQQLLKDPCFTPPTKGLFERKSKNAILNLANLLKSLPGTDIQKIRAIHQNLKSVITEISPNKKPQFNLDDIEHLKSDKPRLILAVIFYAVNDDPLKSQERLKEAVERINSKAPKPRA